MKRVLLFIKENLDITQKEAKSTLAFLSVTLFSILIYGVVNYVTISSESETLVTIYAAETPPVKTESPKSYEAKPTFNQSVERFRFNPNTATKEDFIQLGIPAYVANSILKYRDKGGSFRTKADFKKIYNLKPELYGELYRWIDLPESRPSFDKEEYRAESSIPTKISETSAKEKTYTNTPNPPLKKFDINTADTTLLKKVRGIGSTYASRIVKYRDAMGGFHSLSQLEETYGLPPETVNELKKFASIETKHKTIQINEVESLKHPTLKFAQAKAIIAYRNQHGPFTSIQDLNNIKLLDEETITKIAPYLSF
jgi:competence protein ComEA